MNVIFNKNEKRVITVFNVNGNEQISLPNGVDIVTVETRHGFIERFGEYDGYSDFVSVFPSLTNEAIKAIVNDRVEHKRLEFITSGTGQAIVYILKQQQLAAFRSNGNTNAEIVAPILVSEAGVRNMSIEALADEWEYNQTLWFKIAAQLEGIRMGAFTSLLSAKTDGDVIAILVSLEQSLAQILPQ